jgi:endogenous inhibitor of DNA gyrase (YacG/DUF329 family)
MPPPKDPVKYEEWRRKHSELGKKRWEDPEYRRKMTEEATGKKQSPETIAKRISKIKDKPRTPLTKKTCLFCGKELLLAEWEKNRLFCSMKCKGKWQSENAVGEKSSHWQGGDILKKCENCGKEYKVEKHRDKKARFCSPACKGTWMAENGLLPKLPVMIGANHPQWKGGDVTKKCEECGKEFTVERARNKTGKFCSSNCRVKWLSKNNIGEKNPKWRRITKTCEECGKDFIIQKKREGIARFCSMACHGKWLSKNNIGENNPSWTGGSKEYCEKWSLEFRRRIRAFFDYICAECGTPQNEKLLHCHHVYYDKKACCSVNENGKYYSNLGIKEQPYTFEIVGDPNKFIALCDNCHKKTSGKKNREYWARHFEEIINNYYLGKSYFTKEEYEKIR